MDSVRQLGTVSSASPPALDESGPIGTEALSACAEAAEALSQTELAKRWRARVEALAPV